MGQPFHRADVQRAELGGRLVRAVGYVGPGQPKREFFNPEWPIVRLLSVLPSCRGLGIDHHPVRASTFCAQTFRWVDARQNIGMVVAKPRKRFSRPTRVHLIGSSGLRPAFAGR
jgi:hypothetical protein